MKLPIARNFYDIGGRLWKTQHFEKVVEINSIATPLLIRMVDHQNYTSTEYRVSDLCYGQNVPDDVFRIDNLPEALDSAFCKVGGKQ